MGYDTNYIYNWTGTIIHATIRMYKHYYPSRCAIDEGRFFKVGGGIRHQLK